MALGLQALETCKGLGARMKEQWWGVSPRPHGPHTPSLSQALEPFIRHRLRPWGLGRAG